MMEPGNPVAYLEEDNRTLHTNFLKGLERSGKTVLFADVSDFIEIWHKTK